MCGRFTLEPTAKFYPRFGLKNKIIGLKPRYNIAPGQDVPVVVKKNEHNELALMRWGLVPHWAQDPKIGYKMINARAESLAQKPSFRNSLKFKRCLVPTSGFYEWQKIGTEKIPYYIHLKEHPFFAFACLYDIWKDEAGKDLFTFTIITTEPSHLISKIHNRMPVILRPEEEAKWIDSKIIDEKTVLPFLKTYEGEEVEAYRVSKRVNKADFDSKLLIKPEGKKNAVLENPRMPF
jgi:putative SOS response-associated peptidase YedK